MFVPARERQVATLAIRFKFLANLYWINPLIRKLNPLLKLINIQLSFSRYQSTIYFYKNDKINYLKYKNDILINFGSGGFIHSRWINYDFPGASFYYKNLQGSPGKDFYPIDLTENKKLPFDSGTVALIYCSHTIEHLPEVATQYFLSECARILKSGGRIRLAYPDFDYDVKKAKIFYDLYGENHEEFIGQCKYAAHHMFHPSLNFPSQLIVTSMINSRFNTQEFFKLLKDLDSKNGDFRASNPEYHLSYWSHEKLSKICKEIGFDKYIPELAGQSDESVFRNTCVFDTTEPQLSLYGELIKI